MTESSFGIIPLKKIKGVWHALLIKQYGKYWCFPKGHSDKEETPLETATRELKEETGLKVKKLVCEEQFSEHYTFFRDHQRVDKQVSYFLALVDGVLKLQKEEISDAKWVKVNELSENVTYPELKALCKQIQRSLKSVL